MPSLGEANGIGSFHNTGLVDLGPIEYRILEIMVLIGTILTNYLMLRYPNFQRNLKETKQFEKFLHILNQIKKPCLKLHTPPISNLGKERMDGAE